MSQRDIKKGFKSYLKAKELMDNDPVKSILYFKQTLKYLNNCENNKYKDIISKTLTECDKLMSQSIESTFMIDNVKIPESKVKIFNLIEKGKINDIRNLKKNQIEFKSYNKDGETPLHLCIKMGDMNLLKVLLKKCGDIDITNKKGNTLLELACLENDPNAISFLLLHGADMKKHLYFRNGNRKFVLNKSSIDLANIMKIILNYYKDDTDIGDLEFVLNYIDKKELIGLDNLDLEYLLKGLANLLDSLDNESKQTYLNIIREEISQHLINKLGCPENKIDLLLINLVPFIDYPFNLSIKFLISLEIKFLILKVLKKNYSKISSKTFNKLIEILWKKYVNPKIISSDYLGICTHELFKKIKSKII